MRIPITKPFLDQAEQLQVTEVLKSGWLMQGPRVAEFEDRFKDYIKSKYAVAVSSCSTALQLAMKVCGLKAGDEVILPSFTWVATAAAVEECGARPVFCDIDPHTFNIDADQVEDAISSRTKVIIGVNLFGLAANLPRLREIATKNHAILVEDAACSLGATIAGKHTGTFGRLACFSFHPRKSITTGEGGMITGDNPIDGEILRSLRSHGYEVLSTPKRESKPNDLGDVDKVGYNYRLTDLQAAIGLAQMNKLEGIISRKREIADIYDQQLAGLAELSLPVEPAGYRHTYQSYVTVVDVRSDPAASMTLRNEIMLSLERKGIATRPGTHAVHSLAYYKRKYNIKNEACPNSLKAMNQTIALPLYPTMTEQEIDYVISNVRSAIMELAISTRSEVAVN
jgi:dTDP-4-amino-4,6-dideoxygalactose transaminase